MKTGRIEEIECLARPFFKFFEQFGVFWWQVEIQSRRVDGTRGAPLGCMFGSRRAWRADRTASAAAGLEKRVEAAGRRGGGLDLVCVESAGPQGLRRIVLIDDLDGCGVDELLQWWLGPAAILETSSANYQALLVLNQAQLVANHLSMTRVLSAQFGGDPGAISSGQLHRFPGSQNNKFESLDEGGPFLCGLVKTRLAAGVDHELRRQQKQILDDARAAVCAAPTPIKTGISSGPDSPRVRDKSNSGRALSWAMSEVRRGATMEQILSGLGTDWLSHHDPIDWPKRTLQKAIFYLSQTRA